MELDIGWTVMAEGQEGYVYSIFYLHAFRFLLEECDQIIANKVLPNFESKYFQTITQ